MQESGSKTVWVLLGEPPSRYAIPSEEALRTLYQGFGGAQFAFKDIVTISNDEMATYPDAGTASGALPGNGRSEPDGRLMRAPGGSTVAIVTDGGRRREFPDVDTFVGLGYVFANVVEVGDYDSYPLGPPVIGIRGTESHPTAIAPDGVVSAASYQPGPIAPESWVAVFGENLAAELVVASGTPLPTSLGGTTVTIVDSLGVERLAQLQFVSPRQVNFLAPS